MTPNERILQCIYNINTIVSNIQSVNVHIEELKLKPDTYCHDDLTRYSYLKICAFLDEMDILNSFSKDDNSVLDIMYSIKPFMQIVSKYKTGFKQTRNSMLAHLNRDTCGNFVPAWKKFNSLKLPRDIEEMNLIYGSLDMIRVILIDSYKIEFRKFHDSIVTEIKDESKHFIYSQEPLIDFNEIINQVERRLKERGLMESEANFRKKFAPSDLVFE
jgi:hypothetical protein